MFPVPSSTIVLSAADNSGRAQPYQLSCSAVRHLAAYQSIDKPIVSWALHFTVLLSRYAMNQWNPFNELCSWQK